MKRITAENFDVDLSPVVNSYNSMYLYALPQIVINKRQNSWFLTYPNI